MRHAKHGASAKTLFHGLHDGRMAVASHERAEAEVVIDVLVTVQIAELTASPFLHEDGIGIVGAIVTGHAERNAFEILFVGFGGLGSAPLEGCKFFLQVGIHRESPENSGRRAAIRMVPGPPKLPGHYQNNLEKPLQRKLELTWRASAFDAPKVGTVGDVAVGLQELG